MTEPRKNNTTVSRSPSRSPLFHSVDLGTQHSIKLPCLLYTVGEKQPGERRYSGRALAIYTDLIHQYGKRPRKGRIESEDAMVTVPLSTFETNTGYKKSQSHAAIQELSLFINVISNPRDKGSTYVFLNPETGKPLKSHIVDSDGCADFDGPQLIANKINKLQYFEFPECVLTRDAHWSLRHMSSGEVELYYALWWTANHKENKTGGTAWTGKEAQLREASRLDPKTFKKAISGLQDKGLILYETKPTQAGRSPEYTIELLDPDTSEPFAGPRTADEDDSQNYFVIHPLTRKREKFWSNIGALECDVTHEWLDFIGYPGPRVIGSEGWVQIICPFHDDKHPSCGVTPRGFHCWSCGEKGNLRKLATKFGRTVFAVPPDKAIEVYLHRNEAGYTAYRLARYPDLPNGVRDYAFEHKVRGSWLPGCGGKMLLYNLDLIQNARTLILTEGQKDADTATALGFIDEWGSRIVGTTSGGKDSWEPKFAKQFRDRRVIFIPDTDGWGEKYRKAVRASFDAAGMVEGIDYIEVLLADVKDLTEYRALPDYSHEALARLIGHGWIGGIPGNSNIIFGRVYESFEDELVEI